MDKDKNRRIVALIPKTKTPAPYYFHLDISNLGFKRRKFTFDYKVDLYGEMVKRKINMIYEPLTDELSLCENGSRHSVNILARVYTAISKRLLHKTSPPMIHDVERILHADNYPEPHIMGPILFDLLGAIVPKGNYPSTNDCRTKYVPRENISFQTLSPLITEDGKLTGRQLSAPLVEQPAIFPRKSVNNECSSIGGRVIEPKNNKVPPVEYVLFSKEFSELLIADSKLKGLPWTYAQVADVQNKPMQKARSKTVEATNSMLNKVKIKAFLKMEAYSSSNEPRNISSMSAELTTGMSCFTYPFKNEILKHQEWYGPGKTPKQIEDKIQCITDEAVIISDFHRMDGSISEWLQVRVGQNNYMSWCSQQHQSELLMWFRKMHAKTATTESGLSYSPGYGTKSGSPPTTDINTLVNLFVIYSSLRKSGNTKQQSWSLLDKNVIVCGDDGMVKYMPTLDESMYQVCSDLGLRIKIEIIPSGSPVPYCGRYFVDTQTGISSLADPIRTLAKLHLTSNTTVTDKQALVNKATGYFVTDSNTPIIGQYCKRALELNNNLAPKAFTQEEQWRMGQPWTQSNTEAISKCFNEKLGVDQTVIDTIVEEIQHGDLSDIKNVIPNKVKHKVPAIVAGELVAMTRNVVNNNNTDHRTFASRNTIPVKPNQFDRSSDSNNSRRNNQTNNKWKTADHYAQPRIKGNSSNLTKRIGLEEPITSSRQSQTSKEPQQSLDQGQPKSELKLLGKNRLTMNASNKNLRMQKEK
nr:RNA-dependent RNA polymerase [Flumine nodavirus 10]